MESTLLSARGSGEGRGEIDGPHAPHKRGRYRSVATDDVGGKEVLVPMLTPTSGSALTVLPPAGGAPVEHVLAYPELNFAIAAALALSVLAAAFAVLWLTQRERIQSFVRRRLQAVRNSQVTPRVATPLRRGVGGVSGRVPPRSAAGSTLSLRLTSTPRVRRR